MASSSAESKAAVAVVIERICAMMEDVAADVETDVQKRELCTRYAVIDPILWALGWETWNTSVVRVEYQLKNNSSHRVDYALLDKAGSPAVLVEAKTWGKSLDTHVRQLGKYANQLDGYARGMAKGVACITDGWEWRIYDLSQRGRFVKKQVEEINIREDRSPAHWLNHWLRKSRWW